LESPFHYRVTQVDPEVRAEITTVEGRKDWRSVCVSTNL